jgi:hypothetical protein
MARRNSAIGLMAIVALGVSACAGPPAHGISTKQLVYPPGSTHLKLSRVSTTTVPPTTTSTTGAISVPPPTATATAPPPSPAETTTTQQPCTGELSSTITEEMDGGSTGTVTNGRTDAVEYVEVWYFGGSAYVYDSIPPGGSATWSGPAGSPPVSSITYVDESFGQGCAGYETGGTSP